jgi:hypothetical protein
MLLPKSSVTPRFEFHDFVGYQRFDGLKQLFLEEFLIKTHSCENRFEIIEHLLHLKYNYSFSKKLNGPTGTFEQ